MNKLHIIDGKIRFESVRGVGTIEVDFQPNQRVYVFIGKNGVGKTKLLECLCQSFNPDDVEYKVFTTSSKQLSMKLPLVYVPTILRNAIVEDKYEGGESIGNLNDRRTDFKEKLIRRLRPEPYPEWTDNIHRWIILRAQSSNRYQSKQDNRGFELEELLRICHQIDKNIDAEFLEIDGNNRVFLQVEKQKRELSELSSGFASILKIVQTIIDGYSSLTNEQQLANVRGVVLIDEIESHLHNEWQVNIISCLKRLFPNTTFFVATHSSLVISQLQDGEAYQLQREKDGVVYGKAISHPARVSLVDLLNDAFGVNLNQLKINQLAQQSQQGAKQALLELAQAKISKKE